MNANPQSNQIDYAVFLKQAGWDEAEIIPLSADMGLRRYFKLTRGNDKKSEVALLMDMSRAGILETGLAEFLKVGRFLNDNDINAPEIFAFDVDQGLAIIEYLGDTSFGDALKQGVDAEKLYSLATDILIKIRDADNCNQLELNGYKDTLIWQRVPQFVDYYMPLAADNGAGRLTTQTDHDEFQQVWKDIEAALPSCPMGVCLGDYHLENLIWRGAEAEPQYGVIDFQDAFWSPQPYDLLNLLEDARVSVPQDIKDKMIAQYCAGMSAKEQKIFQDWYVVMSAQFHCRVIGLFVKFARENGGVEFLTHIPRLQGYIAKNLKNPALKPLKEFMEGHNISLNIEINQ